MFGAALLTAFSAFKKSPISLAWFKLTVMTLCAVMAISTGYNMAGALFGITSTVLAWFIFIGMLRDKPI